MKKDMYTGFLVGAVSYLIVIWVMFTKGLGFIFGLGAAPFLYFFPEFNNPNVGMGGLPIFWLGGFIGFATLPFLLWGLAKMLHLKISGPAVATGFLGMAIIANILNMIFKFA